MTGIVAVGVGGLAGVLARYGLTLWIRSIWMVAAINLLGSFLLGVLVHVGGPLPAHMRDALGVGFLGGFTTLSTLTTQTVLEVDGGRPAVAFAYLTVSVGGGLLCAALGYLAGRAIA